MKASPLAAAASLRLPLGAYLASRLVVAAAALLAINIRSVTGPNGPLTSVLVSMDGAWYRSIVENGYPSHVAESGGRAVQSSIAFFPLYPLVVKSVDLVGNLRLATALVLVSTVCGAVAVCLLWRTVRTLFDAETADEAALLFCFFPGAFVLSYAYAESLMLCLGVACLAALHRRRWLLAGIAGALATATRPNAVVLVAAAAWASLMAIRQARDWRSLLAPAMTPIGMIAFLAYVRVHTGDPQAYWRVQRDGWGQRFDFGAGVVDDLWNFVLGSRRDLDHVIVMGGVAIVVAGLAFLLRSRLPFIYTIYTVGILALALGSENLSARPRFVLTAFPLLIGAARVVPRRLNVVLTACGAATMALLVVWYQVAPPGSVPP